MTVWLFVADTPSGTVTWVCADAAGASWVARRWVDAHWQAALGATRPPEDTDEALARLAEHNVFGRIERHFVASLAELQAGIIPSPTP